MHMKRVLFSILIAAWIFTPGTAQNVARGMNYQAVMRDARGKVLSNTPTSLRFSFSRNENGSEVLYSEVHQVITDELGLFNLNIGEGKSVLGAFNELIWASEALWLSVETAPSDGQQFELLGRTALQSVPYAYHAATASQLYNPQQAIDLPTEKNQSIYWTTGGNTNTRPTTHLVGTRDNQDFVWRTFAKTRAVFTKEGQLQIKSGVDGSKDNKGAYPLTIEGSKQGIWIQINGERSEVNNFLNFADANGVLGSIAGQTLSELKNSPDYRIESKKFNLRIVSLTAQAVGVVAKAAGYNTAAGAAAASLFLIWQMPGWTVAGAGATALGVQFGAELAQFIIEYTNWQSEKNKSVGSTFSSGAGDYAEWLERDSKVRNLYPGEIVGIKAGKLSLNTTDADHVMVVSTQPAVLGNEPQEKFKANFEKIAFLGQVPVKIVGKAVVGDYIVPSGNHDGLGIAVHPQDLPTAEFSKIVGVAWQSTPEDKELTHYVNLAVGLNHNDLAPRVENLSNKIDNIFAFLEGKGPLRPEGNLAATSTKKSSVEPMPALLPPVVPKLDLSVEAFDELLDQNPEIVSQMFAQAKIELAKRGFELSKYPELARMMDNPTPYLKKLHKDPSSFQLLFNK